MNYNTSSFQELTDMDMLLVDGGGLGLCILGVIGGGLSGALVGAVATPGCVPFGAIVGGLGGAITFGIKGWNK